MKFRNISLEDKSIFEKKLEDKMYMACEYRFSHIYIWKDAARMSVCVEDDVIYIKDAEAGCFLMPIGGKNPLDNLEKLNEHCTRSGEDFVVSSVSEDMLIGIKKNEKYIIERDRDLDDYAYDTSELLNLVGRRYHSKRNAITRFENSYTYSFDCITDADKNDCMFMAKRWADDHEEDSASAELIAIENALLNMKELGLCGGILRVSDQIVGFSIGEITKENMGIVHFEKGEKDFVGVYPKLNKCFASKFFTDTILINRQEDMGLPNLRKAKLSYFPTRMIEKYRITRNEGI